MTGSIAKKETYDCRKEGIAEWMGQHLFKWLPPPPYLLPRKMNE
jgi:hypothetical protein